MNSTPGNTPTPTYTPHSPLGEDLSLDALVNNDTDGVLGHVEHSSSLAMVTLVDQTLLEGSVTLQDDKAVSGATVDVLCGFVTRLGLVVTMPQLCH